MSEFKRVDNEDLAFYLRITPGLHNWEVPRGIGFTDSRGVCRAFVAFKPEGTVCYMNVLDYRKHAAINYEKYKLQKELKKKLSRATSHLKSFPSSGTDEPTGLEEE